MPADTLNVTVSDAHLLTPLVREFTLTATDGGTLPGFSPGSHIQVHLPIEGGARVLRNTYSLVGDPADGTHYRIAVRLQEDSRGGSRLLHQHVQPGDRLNIGTPFNLFAPDSRASHHILVAGGIGITPFMAYVQAFERQGASYELHYASRTGLTDAYAQTLQERLGARLRRYDADHGTPLQLDRLLQDRPLGAHLYCCGPRSLIDSARAAARDQGWSDARVHFEAFAAPQPGAPFTAQLARSGGSVDVAGDQTLLEALEDAGIAVPNLCRGGVCGQCATRHLGGEVEHRDEFLSDEERAHLLMPCVSRCRGNGPLLLDL